MSVIIPTNKYQTPVTDEWLSQFPDEVQEQFLDYIDTVPLIKWMIGERPRAKDLPRDEQGRIIVDITHPHILEDMDYFRPAAKFFEENGCYTLLKPNPNPNSEFGKWFREEVRRCRDGYVRESDGEWVTGQMYFFLNYSVIMLTRKSSNSKIAKRVEGFPDVWEGIYYRCHYLEQARRAGKHALELARRGCGKSFILASMMAHNLILGENSEVTKRVTTVLTAYLKEYLAEKDGTLSKFTPMIDFLAQNTEFPRLMYKRSQAEMTWIMGYKNSNGNIMGSRNSVLGLSVKDDEGKVRGKRGFILFEEIGSYSNFKGVWDNVRDSVKDGEEVFSLLYGVGTAGDKESDFSGVRTILYNPTSYEILPLENVYDKKGKGAEKFAYFFPSYMSRTGCMDGDGNSDVVKALMSILMMRYEVKQGGDSASLLSRIAQMPITPEEAILRVRSTYFPTVMLNERIRQLDSHPHIYDDIYVGEVIETGGGKVEFRSTSDVPIREYPVDNKERGALEIYSLPKTPVQNNRYVIGVDPVDNDKAESESLMSIIVFDLFNDEIVAEYTGRQQFAEDGYEIVRLLAIFYHASVLYESNRKMMFSYFSKKHCTWMLADCPEWIKAKGLVKYNMFGSSAHPYTEKVYTPDGIKRWGDIVVGSRLFGPDGTITSVVDVPFDQECDIYEITLRDGRKVRASDNHKWYVCKGARAKKRAGILMTTKEIMDDIAYTRSRDYVNHSYPESKYYIPKNEGVVYPEQYIPLNPYLVGLILGDGCVSSHQRCNGNKAYFTSIPEDMAVYAKILNLTYTTIDDRHHWIDIPNWTDFVYYLKLDGCTSKTKFIPDCYKYNTRDVRLDILRGLLDTDGTIKREGGTPTYCTTSETLANDVCEVSRSIGINCSMKVSSNSYGKVYTIRFYTMERMFNLPRKYTKQRQTRCRDNYTGIIDIKLVGREKAKCVTVDREDGLYLIGEFITTHNSKGVSVNAPLISTGIDLINSWLRTTKPVEVRDETGEVHIEQVPQLYDIRNRALLEELVSYAPEKNTDRVSALFQVMFLREQFIILYGGAPDPKDADTDASEDEFFDRDWERAKLKLHNYKSIL